MIGQVIGNYRIVSMLGKGGMGMVYRAEHTQLGRPAALKMLLPQLSSDPSIVQRFFNEARAASAIDHPGIVEVYDFGTHTDGAAYIVMALLKGENLSQRMERGHLAPLEGAAIVAQVLGALAAAHARGIVHRDLKPDNIYLVPNELMPNGLQVKLLDFGIAKLADEKQAGFKTQTGMMMGTPAYMSPEQCMGRSDLDHRTDLYSIGCILYHLLTGRPPFLSDQGTGMMIAMHIRDVPPHPRTLNPSIPDDLAGIVMRLLEKEPAARYQTALEVRDALTSIGAGAPSRPPVRADQYAATMAPVAQGLTTASGSAGQALPTAALPTAAVQPAGKSRTGAIVGVGLLVAALAGVGVFAAMRADTKPTTTTASTQAPSAAPAAPAASPPAPAAAPPAVPAQGPELTTAAASPDPCPLGQVRGLDTKEHCCWPDQAWSSAQSRCIGTPKCPDGHKASAEGCEVVVATYAKKPTVPPPQRPVQYEGSLSSPSARPPPPSPPSPPQPPLPPPPNSPMPSFTLSATTIAPGAKLDITFAGPVPSPNNSRSWITIVEAQKPSNQYGAWTYIEDGAKRATLTAPNAPGAYEVRLHSDYPRMSTNVRHSVAVVIKDGAAPTKAVTGTQRNDWRFMLAAKMAQVGDEIEVTFPVAMKAPDGEKFWITIVQKGAGDASYGTWSYVPDGARQMPFKMPTAAGDYEIRLHANYPRLSTNVVHRAPIRVED